MLALGIVASLAVSVAQGWSHGLVGAVVAACPAVSLVGSYELLAWIIRTAAPGGPDHVPAADHGGPQADQLGTGLQAEASVGREGGWLGQHASRAPEAVDRSLPVVGEAPDLAREPGRAGQADHLGGPDRNVPDHADHDGGFRVPADVVGPADDINVAAVAAYRDSLRAGRPLSERKLAEMFGLTSRRWARNRMAAARQSAVTV